MMELDNYFQFSYERRPLLKSCDSYYICCIFAMEFQNNANLVENSHMWVMKYATQFKPL